MTYCFKKTLKGVWRGWGEWRGKPRTSLPYTPLRKTISASLRCREQPLWENKALAQLDLSENPCSGSLTPLQHQHKEFTKELTSGHNS